MKKVELKVDDVIKIIETFKWYGSEDVHYDSESKKIIGSEEYIGDFEIETTSDEKIVFKIADDHIEFAFKNGKQLEEWIDHIYAKRREFQVQKELAMEELEIDENTKIDDLPF